MPVILRDIGGLLKNALPQTYGITSVLQEEPRGGFVCSTCLDGLKTPEV